MRFQKREVLIRLHHRAPYQHPQGGGSRALRRPVRLSRSHPPGWNPLPSRPSPSRPTRQQVYAIPRDPPQRPSHPRRRSTSRSPEAPPSSLWIPRCPRAAAEEGDPRRRPQHGREGSLQEGERRHHHHPELQDPLRSRRRCRQGDRHEEQARKERLVEGHPVAGRADGRPNRFVFFIVRERNLLDLKLTVAPFVSRRHR
jgi:hypothetical protein